MQTLVDKLKEDEFFWEEGKCKARLSFFSPAGGVRLGGVEPR